MIWFKKKTREQQVDCRAESVFIELTSRVEFEFTELETIQILNNVRRKLSEHYSNKKAILIEQSSANLQKVQEINNSLEYLK
jgi:hypothetical protein